MYSAPLDQYIWPLAVCTLMICTVILEIFTRDSPATNTSNNRTSRNAVQGVKSLLEHIRTKRHLIYFALASAVYVYVIDTIGFIISTFVFICIGTIIVRRKSMWIRQVLVTIIVAMLATISLVGLFVLIVGTPLPAGDSPFSNLYIMIQQLRQIIFG